MNEYHQGIYLNIFFQTFALFISFYYVRNFFFFFANITIHVPSECIINKSVLSKTNSFLKPADESQRMGKAMP